MDFVQQLRLQGHPRFPEYTIAQCYSDPVLSDQPDFPELNRLDHFSSHGFRSGALLDSDSDSTEEFSDARSQPGELHSPGGQQTRNLSPVTSDLGRCAQLYDAFHFALQSREHLAKHNVELAAAALVKACSLSTFSLTLVAEQSEDWARSAHDLEYIYGSSARHSLAWAAKAILVGFNFLPTPPRFEMAYNNHTPLVWTLFPYDLSHSDVSWVGNLGKFRAHWAMLKPSDPPPKLVEDLGISLSRDSAVLRHLKEDVAALKTFRPLHPATLQAHNMLQHYLWKEVDPQMKEGFQAALYFFSDPATAMQHVLHCMYTELMGCYGRPKDDVKQRLIQGAGWAMDMYDTLRQTPCRQEGSMWDIVADKLATALLMLGHSFPLQQALDGHRLASFVTEQHKLLRDLLINQKISDMVKVENAVSPESSSFSADAKLNDDDDGPSHKCGRCNRSKKEHEMFVCEKCHETWWCSQACQARDVTTHRNMCKQILLRRKMKSSRKGHPSP